MENTTDKEEVEEREKQESSTIRLPRCPTCNKIPLICGCRGQDAWEDLEK